MNRKLKKSRYQSGGNIKDLLAADRAGKIYEKSENIQKLGDIEFDSNTSRPGPNGQMIVKDKKTGKDFGVIRRRDGSYTWFRPTKLQDNVTETVSEPFLTALEYVHPRQARQLKRAKPYLDKMSALSYKRADGQMSEEEKKIRTEAATNVYPVSYMPDVALEDWENNKAQIDQGKRGQYLRNYLGLENEMKQSGYSTDDSTAHFLPYVEEDEYDARTKKWKSLDAYNNRMIYNQYLSSKVEDRGKSGANFTTSDGFSPLGVYTLGRGLDDRGDYISVYDEWNLEPEREYGALLDKTNLKLAPDINKLNNPFKVYDRIYLSELSPEEQAKVYARDKELKITRVDKRTQKQATAQYQSGGDLISQLGYRNDSPFKNASSLNINSPNISMENVSTPLYGISNQTGEAKLMKPNKKYKFKNTSSVTEVPAYRKGGKINCATGGLLEGLTQAASGIAPFLGPIGAGISAASALAPFVKDLFAKPDDTIVSGSPGAYQIGGDIQMQRSTTTVTPRPLQELNLPLSPRDQNLQQILGMQKDSATPQMRIEHALDMLRLSGQNPEHLKAYHKIVSGADPEKLTIQRKRMDRFRERQTGGDLELSSNAFQVQGNPNVVDGNNYPSLNANLDHNEVVTNTQEGQKFVFSADLTDPQTGKSFADLAAKQEKAKGKAEKLLKTHPYDEQAKSTISMSNANLNHISNIQEAVATVLGYRNSDGSTKQNYQSGGYIDLGEGYFYDPQKHIYLNRGKSGDSVVEPNNYVRSLKEAYDLRNAPYNPNYIRDRQTIGLTPSNTPVTSTPPVTAPTPRTGKTSKPSKVAASDKLGWLEKAQNYNRLNPDPYAEQAEATKAAGGLRETPTSLTMDQRAAIADPNFGARQTFYEEESDTPLQTGLTADRIPATIATDVSYKTPWTLGDTFKGIELLSKGIGAFGKAEKEQPLLDNTQITQEVYDPTQALYSNQRNYQNNLNALSATTPINLRRGIAGSALASRYSADNQVVSQYQQMNQGARSQYQDRVAQQRRFNTASQFRTNEVNAANRAAQDAVQQNFFTSIGQFGEDLNRKRYAADIINLYRNQAPDVFDSYIKTLGTYGR